MPKQLETIVVNGETVVVTKAMRRKWSNNFRDMVRTHSAPGIQTDSTFFAQTERTDQRFAGEEGELNRRLAIANRQGFRPSPGDVYVPELATEVGDPMAWVPATGGRAHVKKATERVRRYYGEKQSKQHPKLADDLADEMVNRMVKRDPKLARASKKEQRQEATKRYGPQR